jgi:hypothetical protein
MGEENANPGQPLHLNMACKRLMEFRVNVEEVRSQFFQFFPLVLHFGVEGFVAVTGQDDLIDVDLIALFLCGVVIGDEASNSTDTFHAWRVVESHMPHFLDDPFRDMKGGQDEQEG